MDVYGLVAGVEMDCLLRAAAKQPWEASEDVLPGVMGAISTLAEEIKWASLRNTSTCAEGQMRKRIQLLCKQP